MGVEVYVLLTWVLDDGNDTLEFLRGEFSGTADPLEPFQSMLPHPGVVLTAWRDRYRPSCRPSWSTGVQHP